MITTLIVSWTSMINNEEYWTKEYLMYAEYMQEESLKTAEKEESMKEKLNA